MVGRVGLPGSGHGGRLGALRGQGGRGEGLPLPGGSDRCPSAPERGFGPRGTPDLAFKNGPFSFAYFEVDDPFARLRNFTISEVRDGGRETPVTPDYASHSVATEAFQARWSFTAEDEERKWIFRYRMSCGIDVYSDTAHLFWQFIGTGWTEPTDRASVTVHLPGRSTGTFDRPGACDPDERPLVPIGSATPLEKADVRAWGHGPLNGEVRLVDPQTIVFDVRDVPPASFVEGSILFPTDTVPLAPVTVDRPRMNQILEEERSLANEANALRRRHRAERAAVVTLLVLVPLACALLALMAWLRDRVPGVPRILREPRRTIPWRPRSSGRSKGAVRAARGVPDPDAAHGDDRSGGAEGGRTSDRSSGPDDRQAEGARGARQSGGRGLPGSDLRT